MKNLYFRVRNGIELFLYRTIAKPIFFTQDPEVVHDSMTSVGKLLGSNFLTRAITAFFFNYQDKSLQQEVAGIKFRNPIGLAAGFDKSAEMTGIMPAVGFGFMELGSITGEPCEGNPKPRLWRLPKSNSLLVYYGLKNDGAEAISRRLELHTHEGKFRIPAGINIAKTNSKDTVEEKAAIADYAKAYKSMLAIGDYYTVNISCPNAFGGEPFTDVAKLDRLLTELDKYYIEGKPVFVKLSPDLKQEVLDELLEIAEQHKVDGFICTNLTKDRDLKQIKEKVPSEKGGLSGEVVRGLSDEMISYIYRQTKGKKLIIGLGGVFTAEDAYRKIRNGASLVQLVTGMIFLGPQAISEINRGLVQLLKKDGFKSIGEAVGVDVK